MLKKLIYFLVYSNLFSALLACAITLLNQKIWSENSNLKLISFIFFATCFLYNFHWVNGLHKNINSKRQTWSRANKKYLIFIVLLCFIASLILSFDAANNILYFAPIALLSIYYSIQQSYRLSIPKISKTVLLTIIWTFTTSFSVVILNYSLLYNTHFILWNTLKFLLIYQLCLLFDARDMENDEVYGTNLLNWKKIKTYFFISSLMIIIASLFFKISITITVLLIQIILTKYILENKIFKHELTYTIALDLLMILPETIYLLI